MAGYCIGIHRDMRMRKALLAKFSSAEFKIMPLNSKLSKVVSYIQVNKAWERVNFRLILLFSCIWFLFLADSNKAGMEKVFY